MQQADRAIVDADPAIGGLGLLFDDSRMQCLLRRQLPALDLRWLESDYRRYKPGQNALVRYRLQAGSAELVGYAKAYGADATAKLAKDARRPTQDLPGAPGRLLLAEQGLLFCLLPNDNKLPALSRLFDAAQCAAALSKLHVRRPAGYPLTEVLQYKPERRLALRLHGAAGSLFFKAFAGNAMRPALAALQALGSEAEWLGMPPPIGHRGRRGWLLQPWLEGRPLTQLLAAGPADRQLQQLGARLARLHRLPTRDGLPRVSGHQQQQMLDAQLRLLQHLLPPRSTDLQQLFADLSQRLQAQPLLGEATLHGDCYADQVLCAGERLHLLDWDRACIGDPALDLGNFIAHLRYLAATRRLSEPMARRAASQLLDGYRAAGRLPPALKLGVAFGLARLLARPFRDADPQWPARTLQLVDELRRCGHSRRPARAAQPRPAVSPVRVLASPAARRDAQLANLPRALDPDYMRLRLTGLLPGGGSLRRIELLRHRRGRRALIEYEIAQAGRTQRLIAKLRGRGLDRRTWQLNQRLWQAGFDDSGADGLSLPRPLGTIDELGVWCQLRVAGRPAWPEPADPRAARRALQQAAAMLAKLHASAPSGRAHRMADELSMLERQLAGVRQMQPGWGGRIERIEAAARAVAQDLPEVTPVLLHRDWYPDQLLLDGDRAWLLDLDLAADGDPALDVGNYAAHLLEWGLRQDRAVLAQDWAEQFVDDCLRCMPSLVQAHVEVYLLLTLVRHVAISQRIADRRRLTPAIMALCERRLGIGAPGRRTYHQPQQLLR